MCGIAGTYQQFDGESTARSWAVPWPTVVLTTKACTPSSVRQSAPTSLTGAVDHRFSAWPPAICKASFGFILQRRAVQLSGAESRALSQGGDVPDILGHRGGARGVETMGPRVPA